VYGRADQYECTQGWTTLTIATYTYMHLMVQV